MRRVVLVTGVAGGIGTATASVFSRAGWRVIGVDRWGASVAGVDMPMQADIGEASAVEHLFERISDEVGQLDTLVNNAAVQICKPLVETSAEEWDEVLGTNLRGVFLAVKHAYPLLRRGGAGSIVNVSSVHAVATSPLLAAYAASKGGVLALTRGLALELAPDRIRVNAVLPGAVDTSMLHDGLRRAAPEGNTGEALARLGSRTALGRVGQPEEIAEAILFLSDHERSSFLTGQSITVDGGATCRLSTE